MSQQHIFIAINGAQQGPYTMEQVEQMAGQGTLPPGTLCWHEGLPQWTPVERVLPSASPSPPPLATPPATPARAPMTGGLVTMDIIRTELYQMPKLTLNNAEVIVESGAMHYMRGPITMEAKAPSVGGFMKSKLTREKAVRPRYRGTGELYLVPSFGEYEIMDLRGETWILDKGAFLACETGVSIGVYTNKAFSGLFGGEGFFQTQVSGSGKVLFHSPGPLERIELANDTLVVDGSFAVARTASLEYSLSRASKGLFGSWISGEGMVSTFRGMGTVLIAPVPNRYVTLFSEINNLGGIIRTMRGKG